MKMQEDFIFNLVDWRSVSTMPCRATPPLGTRGAALAASLRLLYASSSSAVKLVWRSRAYYQRQKSRIILGKSAHYHRQMSPMWGMNLVWRLSHSSLYLTHIAQLSLSHTHSKALSISHTFTHNRIALSHTHIQLSLTHIQKTGRIFHKID